jgi:molybdopterin converting factor small subunit
VHRVKIHLKIEGMPQLYQLFHKKKALDVEFAGRTLRDCTTALIQKYGPGVKKAVFDQSDEIDMELRVVVNMTRYLSYGERMDTPLNDGDTLHLMTVG